VLEVGRIAKPHGIRGDVIVELITNRAERVAPGAVLHAPDRLLTVAASRPHQGRWIVTFEGIPDRNAAESLRDTVLSAEPLDDPDELWVHELVGAAVVGVDGEAYGTVESVEANPASDLLVLDGGGLVPLTFVVEQGDGRVVVDIPEGLLDLS
jgi:16S rRNA processing protein RimM